ncbi:MAG: type III-A CRISPR-associated protein Csm2 [Elusimicrobia bacterium]|nr:type III-A CRISPR-associated protein Csm2 [Elusimicrobiota bacterium]
MPKWNNWDNMNRRSNNPNDYNRPQNNYQNKPQIQLPEIKFWNDETRGIINQNLFSDTAKEIAEKLNSDSKSNKPTQIRKFYDELLRIRGLIKNEEDFKKQLAYIYMIKPKVAYAKGRKLVSDVFYDFINLCINENKIKTLQDFDVFLSLFEAVIAYYKMLNPKED